MKCLLDTQVAIWAIKDPARISGRARTALEDPANTPLLSAASYWEISIKLSLGKLELASGWEKAIEQELAAGMFIWLPITREHCGQVSRLPFHHRDPFDRLLVAQALAENAVVVTNDGQLNHYDVEVLW